MVLSPAPFSLDSRTNAENLRRGEGMLFVYAVLCCTLIRAECVTRYQGSISIAG